MLAEDIKSAIREALGSYAPPARISYKLKEAAKAYDEAARRLHGEFAFTNF